MSSVRLVACAAVLCSFAVPAAQAAPDGKFTIAFPAGWTAPVDDGEATEARAPAGGSEAWCRANSNDMPSLAASTQAQLNEQHGDPWTRETWASVLTVPAEKMQISANTSAVIDGHVMQETTITFAEDVLGGKATGRFVSHVLVGRMVNAACFAPSENYDGVKDLFETTVTSLKPIG